MTTSLSPLHQSIREDDLTQECKDLIASLPKQKGFVSSFLYQYQGVWLSPKLLQSAVSLQKHFEPQDTDILIASNPKTGTTWLKAITFCILNRSRYLNTSIDHPLLSHNPHSLVTNLEFDLYIENPNPDLTAFLSPRLFATHLPYGFLPNSLQDSGAKVVYICRNPKDTFVSYWKFSNKLKPNHTGIGTNDISLEDGFDLFCNGVVTFGPLWEHVLGYWNASLRRPEKVLFLKYEDLKEQPSVVLSRIAKFIGVPFSAEEEKQGVIDGIIEFCSFGKLSNLEVNKEGKLANGIHNQVFFRQGETGDWKNYLTDAMADRLDKIIEQKFSGAGLEF